MRIPIGITGLIVASWITAACNLPLSTVSGPTPAAVASEPTGVPLTPFSMASPTSLPTPTTGAPSPTLPIACPVPAGSPSPPLLQSPTTYVQDILTFLDGGGSPHGLQADVESAGLSPQKGMPLAEQDFNGDGLNDIAVSLLIPNDAAVMPPGVLYVFLCVGQAYTLAFTGPSVPELGAPEILEARDLNANGAVDLLVARETCGAHTCFSRLEVLVWEQDTLVNVFQGTSDDLPYPSIRVVGPGPDGRFDIAVTGTAIGSAGAGPYRGVTRTWAWNPAGDALLPGPDLPLPSTFRIHVLNDADQADREGRFAAALELYGRVIHDDTLQDWIDPQAERANLGAYAMFREVVTYLQLSDQAKAQSSYLALTSAFPPSSVGGAYALLGEAFWTAYQSSGDVGLACVQAQAFAQANEATILQPLYFGYANPVYTSGDICPTAGP